MYDHNTVRLNTQKSFYKVNQKNTTENRKASSISVSQQAIQRIYNESDSLFRAQPS